MKLTPKQETALKEIGHRIVCRVVATSKTCDAGCYVLPGGELFSAWQVSGHVVGALIRKGILVQAECPEKFPPPHAMYYKRKEEKDDGDKDAG